MSDSLIIRQENPTDQEEVYQLIKAAFANEPHSDSTEQDLVQRLQSSNSFIPELSLVAEMNGYLAGHILLTPVKIRSKEREVTSLALAPVSVSPEFQRKGVGGALIRAAHEKAKELGFRSIVLIGHEGYYPKFDYQPAHTFGITFPFEAPSQNCMAVELVDGSLSEVSGEVVYPTAFFG